MSSKFYLVYDDPEHDPEHDHNYDPDPGLEHDDQESEVQMPEEEAFTVLVRIMQEYRLFSSSYHLHHHHDHDIDNH